MIRLRTAATARQIGKGTCRKGRDAPSSSSTSFASSRSVMGSGPLRLYVLPKQVGLPTMRARPSTTSSE